MIDPIVLLTPVLLLAVFALVRFVGCLSTPTPPGPTIAAAPGDSKIYLAWEPFFSSDVYNGGYHVKRSTTPGGPYVVVGNVPARTGTFTDRGLTNGTTHFYVVSQDTTEGESNNSNEVSAVPAPIAFLQSAEFVDESNNNTDTVATPPFNSLSLGSLVVVWIWYHSTQQTVSAVSDTVGNVYQRAGSVNAGTVLLADSQQEIWYARNAVAGTAVTVSALFTGLFADLKVISAHQYFGAAPGAPFDEPFDVASAATGSGAAVSSGSAVASDSGLIFGAALFSNVGTAGPGFVQRSALRGNVAEEGHLTAPGPVEATFTSSTPGQSWLAQMAVFR